MPYQAKPISFKPPRLKGLSAKLIASHYENNYGGAVRRLNAIRAELAAADPAAIPPFRLNGLKREELIATNSMLLHEAYFEAMGEGGGGDPTGALAEAMARDFGSVAKWRAEFVAMGKALRGGSGWVLLSRSPRDGTLSNVWAADHTHTLAGGTVVLALDMYEHSYALDFGANADGVCRGLHGQHRLGAHRQSLCRHRAGGQAAHDRHAGRAPADRERSEHLRHRRPLGRRAASVPVRLPRARRAPPNQVDAVAASLPKGAKAVVYCAWGFEIGGDCAAKLRERGIDAVAVAGGIGTWRADGLPTEPLKEGEPS